MIHVARAVGLRHLLGFRGICRDSEKTGPPWSGWRNMRPAGSVSDCIDLPEVARLLGVSQKMIHVSRAVGLRHLLGFLGIGGNSEKTGHAWSGGGRNIRPPGSAPDCVGSSRSREMSRRFSETDPRRPRGGFAPFTRISRDRSEFRENRACLGSVWRNMRPPDPCPIAYDLPEVARFLGDSQKLIHVARAVGLRHLL